VLEISLNPGRVPENAGDLASMFVIWVIHISISITISIAY